MTIQLTAADKRAIAIQDSDYLNTKGANYYAAEDYARAIAYYHLASAMGNLYATSNLGYCYLYGRSIPVNVDLAIAYFEAAAAKGSVDALYKLGDIYHRDKWVTRDEELAIYYFQRAVKEILGHDGYSAELIQWDEQLDHYPSLCLALGRAHMRGGLLGVNVAVAYEFLEKAKSGYELELANGMKMYQRSYDFTLKLLDDECFTAYRDGD